MNPKEISLALFLTRGIPMEVWRQTGTLRREIKYYLELAACFRHITLISCGDRNEISFLPPDLKISVLYNKWNLSPNIYSFFAPFLHRNEILKTDIIKTNQLDGAWTAIIAGRLLHKPVIVRAGYIWSDFFLKEVGNVYKARLVNQMEKWCLLNSDMIFVTTNEIKDRLLEKYNLAIDKIHIIPNFIDTNIFYPNPEIIKEKRSICYVGRLTPIKNVDLLIRAASQISDISLKIIGRGKQENELIELSQHLNVNVRFLGQMNNEEIPSILHKSEIFILPSALEGHPKALIEAMACGCTVIGANVPGIRNVINHEHNGYLCPPTVEGIREAIIHLLNDPILRKKLSGNASAYAQNEFGIKKIADLETQIIMDFLSSTRSRAASF